MSDARDGMANDRQFPFTEHLGAVTRDMTRATVDLGWLENYDLDMIDAAEVFLTYQAREVETNNKKSPFASKNDLLVYAQGIGRPIADSLDSCRKVGGEEMLVSLLYHIASLAYGRGVRDAHDGRLSPQTVRELAKRWNRLDEKHEAMRELYDDIRVS